MTEKILNKIKRLLDERTGKPASAELDLADARLVATFAEGLRDSTRAGASPGGASTMAAFIDGRLAKADLDDFTAALAGDQSLRADLESTAALVDSIADASRALPKDLLARASAQFTPTAPPLRVATRIRIPVVQPRRWAWAAAAAILVFAVIGPGALLVDRFSGPGTEGTSPEIGNAGPTASPAGDDIGPQKPSCEEATKEKPKAEHELESKDDPSKPKGATPPNDKDPCQPFTPDEEAK